MKKRKRLELEFLKRHCEFLGVVLPSSKATRGKSNIVEEDVYRREKKIKEINMGSYNQYGMHIFGANVQLARAIPNIADGFKPVARRVLYSMSRISHADKKLKKALGLKGDVIKIHPHGDDPVEDVITGLSKDWEMNYPLVLIDGNNGSPDGEPAAAARYLDARLSDYAYDCYFADWDPNLVEMRPTYNQDEEEPDYLISKYPDILLRPSTGFTFGVATSIPSYNLEEAFNAMIELIKDRNYNPVLIPDMPSGCIIMDEGQFPTICANGVGGFKMRAEINIDERNNQVVIMSLPYKVALKNIKKKLVALKQSSLSGLRDMFDGSDENGVRLDLTFAPGTDLNAVKALLYKKTDLECSFNANMRYVDMEQRKVLLYNLKDIMLYWLDNRRNVKRKFYINKFVLGKERLNLLEVMIDICSDTEFCETIIKMIRKSKRTEIVEALRSRYKKLSSTQALGLSKMRLEDLSDTSHAEYVAEQTKLKDDIKEYDEIIHSAKKIDKIIIKELEEGIRKYARPRRCRIVKASSEDEDAVIAKRDFIIVITRNGYIKKLDDNIKEIGEFNPGDDPVRTIKMNNTDTLILFDSNGVVHSLQVSDVPEMEPKSKGISLTQFIRMDGTMVSVLAKSEITDKSCFLFATKNGLVKLTEADKFVFRKSVVSIILKRPDQLVSVIHCKINSDVIMYTNGGFGVRFSTEEITPTSRISAGVIGIDLQKDDAVVGLAEVNTNDTHFMIITQKGMGKVCPLDSFEMKKRRGEPLKLITISGNDAVAHLEACNDKNWFIMIQPNMISEVDFDEFPEMTRTHYGKKIVPVRRGDAIVWCIKM